MVAWRYSVVPFSMKRVTLYGEGGKLLIRDFDPLRVSVFIDCGPDAQAISSGGIADQVNDDLSANQGASAPIGGNVTLKTAIGPMCNASIEAKAAVQAS